MIHRTANMNRRQHITSNLTWIINDKLFLSYVYLSVIAYSNR